MVVLFAGGIAMLQRVPTQFRFVFILERVGMSTTAVGVAICY